MTEPFVRPDVRGFLDFLNNIPGPKMHQLDAPAARAQYLAMKDVADPPVGQLGTRLDLAIPGPAGDIPATLFDPRANREPGPVVAFFHGGGFVIGNVETHASFCAEMARALDLPVISVGYRLAPESPWPAAPDDCEAATRWIADSPSEFGRAVTSLIVAGDSAGGNLAVVTAMALRDSPAKVPVIAQLPFYPATDMAQEYPSYSEFADGYLLTRDGMEWFAAAYAAELEHVRTSPLRGDVAGLPPAVIVTASLDPIRDQGRAYAAALAKAGVPVVFREAKGQIHGFITLRQAIPSAAGDVAGALAALKDLIVEAEGDRVMAQAAE
ncbi:alpha/beta hydrolase [Sphingomonas sp.]|jgi:acetyl esterase|uniref:alpha/beta hydrolase n=1 Tax=Sphingomonas sp. TaxID=28214 RepID=UPI002E32F43B|nr:alpha/beta hydrolase [Sphingomonas sp.]HEX4693846.1 alpha/beta hydrolase [Sphingomonas sp.]